SKLAPSLHAPHRNCRRTSLAHVSASGRPKGVRADRGRAQDDRRLHRQDSRRFGTRADEQMHWADRRPMRRRTWRQTPSASSHATCASRQSGTARLNEWYVQAQSHLKDNAAAAAALKDAQRAWIQFRDAKCGYWEKRYEGRHIRLSGNRKLHANRNRTARTRD